MTLGVAVAIHSAPDSKALRELPGRPALVERVDRTEPVKDSAIMSVFIGDSHKLWITFLNCG